MSQILKVPIQPVQFGFAFRYLIPSSPSYNGITVVYDRSGQRIGKDLIQGTVRFRAHSDNLSMPFDVSFHLYEQIYFTALINDFMGGSRRLLSQQEFTLFRTAYRMFLKDSKVDTSFLPRPHELTRTCELTDLLTKK